MVVPRRVPGIVELLEFSNGEKKTAAGATWRNRRELVDFPTGCPALV